MIKSITLSHHRQVQIWLDEVPPAEFAAKSEVIKLVKPKLAIDTFRSRAGVEICIPHGAYVSYGLLGAELVASNVNGLEVIVAINENVRAFQTALAPKSEEVIVGLPQEYAAAVLTGIERVLSQVGGPSNASLRVNWAAYGLVGSSQSIFERMGEIILKLLLIPKDAPEDRLRELFG